jgi:hypothetical protein
MVFLSYLTSNPSVSSWYVKTRIHFHTHPEERLTLFCSSNAQLDDGTGRDPLQVYNFGKAASYLFRPCQNEDGSPDEVRKCPFPARSI